MHQSTKTIRITRLAWITTILVIASGSLIPTTANSVNSGTHTVGFSITGGDMGGGGGGDSCLPIDYNLSTTLGTDVADPAAGTNWVSSDINIVQSDGTSCPANAPISAQSFTISATPFTNNLNVAPNIACDGTIGNNIYAGEGTTDSCASTTSRVNIEVFVPSNATSGVRYESTVTITAVL